jgi:type IV pilus assembly protein PilP
MMQNHRKIAAPWLALLSLALAVSACSSGVREMQTYIDTTKAKPGQPIDPLPEVRPPPSFVYEAGDRRSPFVADVPQRNAANPGGGIGPDPGRPREFLEQVPLDALTMVGTLSNANGAFGLVVDSQGLVHRVTVGNYMGQNHGRIMNITEAEIFLDEIVTDGLGGYYSRPASIGLID